MCFLHCYHGNAHAFLEYLIMIFHTKTFRSVIEKKKYLIQNNLISVDHFPVASLGEARVFCRCILADLEYSK